MKRQRRFLSMLLAFSLVIQTLALTLTAPKVANAKPPEMKAVPPRSQWIEDEAGRTANAKHFRAGDYAVAEIHATPVHYKDQQGKWKPIATSVKQDQAGAYSVDAGHYKANLKVNDDKAEVQVDLGNGRSLRMALDDTSPTDEKTPPGTAKFAASGSGRKIQFQENGGEIDYEYEAGDLGLKETITLKKFTGKTDFFLPITVDGLDIRSDENGGFSLIDRITHEVRAVLTPPVVTDAAGQGTPAVRQALGDNGRGPGIWISVDRDWLEAKDRKYPVVIDPSVVIAPEGADLMAATISQPAGGQVNTMNLYRSPYANEQEVLLKFDLSSVPQGAMVNTALFDVARPFYGGTGGISVYDVKSEWYPPAVTWTSPRGQGTTWTAGGDIGATSYGNLVTGPVTLTALVQSWVNRTRDNNGILLRKDLADWNSLSLSAPTLQVIYALDMLPPTANLGGFTNGAVLTAPFTATVTASDVAPGGIGRIDLFVDGTLEEAIKAPSQASTDFTIDPRRFGPGTHTVKANVYDFAGNEAATLPLQYRADIPEEPSSLIATSSASTVTLNWDAPVGAQGATYNVYRSTSLTAAPVAANRIASGISGTAYSDLLSGPRAEAYYYAVSAVSGGVEGKATTTRVDMVFAPGRPEITSIGGNQTFKVTWPVSPRSGVTYNVYRGDKAGFVPSATNRVASGLTGLTYVDGLNYLANGSFETGSTNDVSSWYYLSSWPYSAVQDRTTAKFGAASLKMWQTCTYCYNTYVYSMNTALISGPITVSGWSKASGVTGTSDSGYSLYVAFYDQWWNYINATYLTFNTGTHDWEQAKYTQPNPGNQPYYVRVWAYFQGNHTGTAWFDGIQVEPGSAPSDYREYVAPSQTPVYRVAAVDGTGVAAIESTASAESSTTTQGPTFGYAASPTVQTPGDGRVQLNWQPAPEPGATYNVYRASYPYTPAPAYLVASGLKNTSLLDGANRLNNSGFESFDYYGVAYNWGRSCSDSCPQTDAGGVSGARSLLMARTNATSGYAQVSQSLYYYQGSATPVTLSAYSRSETMSDGTAGDYAVQATFYDNNWNVMGTTQAAFTSGTHGWERKSVTFTPPRPIYYISLSVTVGTSRTGKAWFDNVQIEEGTAPSDWQDGLSINNYWYYLVRAVGSNGVESQNTNWQYVYNRGGVLGPTDLSARNLGTNIAELKWTAMAGVRYNVERATVDANGYVSGYRQVATGVTGGTYRSSRNLLPNGSFEDDANYDYVPDGWNRTGYTNWNYGGYLGSRYLYSYRNYASDPVAQYWRDVPLDQSAATPLTLSGMVQPWCMSGSVDQDFGLRLELRDSAGSLVGSGTAQGPMGCVGWQSLAITVTPTAPAKTARVIALIGGSHTGSAYFDALQLEAGAQATSYTEDSLAEGTTYSYRLVPIDYWNTAGAPTAAVTVKVTGAPVGVTGQTAQSDVDGRVKLTWAPTFTPDVTYSVYRMPADRVPTAAERVSTGLTTPLFTDAGNLVANSGFDTDQDNDGLPDGWSWLSDGRGAQVVTSGAKFGRGSLQLARTTAAGPLQGISKNVTLRQEKPYPVTVSAWGKTTGVAGGAAEDVGVCVRLLGSSGQEVGSACVPFAAGAADWTRQSATVTPTAPAATAVVQVQVKGTATGTALFDGVQLQPGTTVTDWVDGPVTPGKPYYYRIGAVSKDGRETVSAESATAISRSWVLAAPAGDAPGAGLDDRWAFANLPVPGGAAYLNVNNGNLVIEATDSVVPGPRLAQVFRRAYNSMNGAGVGLMGSGGWTLNVDTHLVQDSATGTLTLMEGDGSSVRFTQNTDGTYAAPPSVWMTLTPQTGNYAWQIARRDGIVYSFDAQGRIRRYNEPNGNALAYNYDDKGRVSEVTGPSTLRAALGYDAANRVHTVRDAAGRTVTYDYDPGTGRLISVIDPMGLTVKYGYDAAGHVSSITDAAGRQVILTYDADGRLATYAWRGVSGTTRFAYSDSQGMRETAITDGMGNVTMMVTNPVGNLMENRDPKGNVTRYDYDNWQRLTQITNARGLVTEIRYETGAVTPRVSQIVRHAEEDITTTYSDYSKYDKPGQVIDPTGVKTVTTYDDASNMLTQTFAAGTELAASTTYTYATGGMPRTITDALGNTTTYETNSLGWVTAMTNPLGGRTSMEYDSAGNPAKSVDPFGQSTTYTYDVLGRRVQTTNPDGGVANWRYDGSGLLVEAVQPGNIQTTYRYDDAGRLIASIDALGGTTRLGYDDAGRQILTFYPNGARSRSDYDELGRVTRTFSGEYLTDDGRPVANAPYVEYAYDSVGNLVRTKLPNGYTAAAEYDLLNRVVKITQPPTTTSYRYDKAGRQLTVQDGLGRWTGYEYDAAGRLTKVYDAANLTTAGEIKSGAQFTAYGYDKLGRRSTVTDPLGYVTSYQYNGLGQVTRETDPLGQMSMYMYDKGGRTLAHIDRNGNVTNYEYDSMGRTTAVHYEDDYRGVAYEYDAGGRRVSMRDRTGVTYYVYDMVGRLVSEDTPSGTIGYSYDPAGLRTAITLQEGSIRYEYDRSNQLRRVVDINGAASSFRYGPSGEILEISLPGGVTQSNTYDSASNRLTAQKYTHTTGRTLSFTYAYDTVGNVTSQQTTDSWDSYRNTGTTYEYDELYRLKYAYNSSSGTYNGYSYDGHGNRVREETGSYWLSGTTYTRNVSGSTDHMYSPAHWLIRSTERDASGNVRGVTEYAYDGEGNLTAALGPNRTERYVYNGAGQMVRAQVNFKFTYNTYDGDGRRVSRRVVDIINGTWYGYSPKESTSISSHYQYDGAYVLAERDGANALRNAYSRAGGQLLSWYKPQLNGETSGAFLTDRLGSVVKMVSASNGFALNQYDYDAFGKVAVYQETVPNDMKFTGALLDSSELYHLSARFYNPSVGRFITQDTYKGSPWQPWTQNLYTYVGNNPVNYVDPTGHVANFVGALIQAWQGTKVHTAVKAFFMAQFTAQPGFTPSVEVKNSAGRADMVLTPPTGVKEVYELKPKSYMTDPKSNAAGRAQLAAYATALSAVPGTTWAAEGTTIPYPGDPKRQIILHTLETDPGMVYYEVTKASAQPQEAPQSQRAPQQTPSSPIAPLMLLPLLPLFGGGTGNDIAY